MSEIPYITQRKYQREKKFANMCLRSVDCGDGTTQFHLNMTLCAMIESVCRHKTHSINVTDGIARVQLTAFLLLLTFAWLFSFSSLGRAGVRDSFAICSCSLCFGNAYCIDSSIVYNIDTKKIEIQWQKSKNREKLLLTLTIYALRISR